MTIRSTSWKAAASVAACALALALAGSAHAVVVFPAIPDLSPYAVVSVGPNASLTINSGPINGKVLVGDGSSVSTSGGNNGSITGGAFADTQALLDSFNGLQVKPTETLVSSTVTTNAFTEALGLQTFLDGLAATQNIAGQINSTTTFTGNGGLNVITFGSLQNATLTFTGGANDFFVMRTSGNVNTNHTMSLLGGVTADHVIWDLDGASGNVLQTSGGNSMVGMFIDTKGGDFQFSELGLNGQLINTGGHIQFVSGSHMNAALLVPGVPEPATWALMIVGLGFVGAALRARPRAATAGA